MVTAAPLTLRALLCINYLSLALISQAQGPSFTVPNSWQKPEVTQSSSQRGVLARGVIDSLIPLFNVSSGTIDDPRYGLSYAETANIISAIASTDHLNSTTNFKESILNSIDKALTPQISGLDAYVMLVKYHEFNTDSVTFGLAAINAVIAYEDPLSLKYAIQIWESMSKYLVTATDAANGSHPTRSVTISSTCQGKTVAGALFFISGTGTTDATVNVETAAAFSTLSSNLYRFTQNQTYGSAAILSAEFIWNQLYNGTIVFDTINLTNCKVSELLLSYNSGKLLEAMSDISLWNSTWISRVQNLIATSIPFSAWTAENGVNTEDQGNDAHVTTPGFGRDLKSYFIRGIFASWNATKDSPDMAEYIEAYVGVQFNALQDTAREPGTDFYSSDWLGPPIDVLLPWGQVNALEVLNAELGFVTPAAPPSSPTSNTSPSAQQSTNLTPTSQGAHPESLAAGSESHTGILVGCIVGGVCLIAPSLLTAVVYLRRRYKQSRKRQEHLYDEARQTTTPFIYSHEPATPSESRSPDVVPMKYREQRRDQPSFGLDRLSAVNPTQAQHISETSYHSNNRTGTADEIGTVTNLLSQLNNILAQIPARDPVRDDAPPQYEQ